MSGDSEAYTEPEFSSQVSRARYFHFQPRGANPDRLILICGGRETCAPDYQIDRTTFPYFAIEWVERGRGEVWLDGRRLPLDPSSVFCYGPDIAYTMRTDPANPMTKCFVDFAGSEARELLARASALPGHRVQVFNVLELSEIFEGLYREATQQTHDSQEIAAVYLRLLLLKIKALLVPSRANSSVRLKTFQRCRQFIQEASRDYTTVEDLAGALGLSPSYLCRLFREHGEVSPYQLPDPDPHEPRPRPPHPQRRLRQAGVLRVRIQRPRPLLTPLQKSPRSPPQPARGQGPAHLITVVKRSAHAATRSRLPHLAYFVHPDSPRTTILIIRRLTS